LTEFRKDLTSNEWILIASQRFKRPTNIISPKKSKVDVAFKVMKKLMDMKILNVNKLTVGKFIELVHELSKEL